MPLYWILIGIGISFLSRMMGKLVWFYWKPRLKRRGDQGYGW
jgi:hypothetical protein